MHKVLDQTELKLKFEGKPNQVDATTLINSLSQITSVIQEINFELNSEFSDNKQVEIKVNAFAPGSFVIDLQLLSGITEFTNQLLSSANIQTTAQILTILTGLLGLKKFLKGKKAKTVKKSGEQVTVEANDNNTIVVDKRTFNIYSSNTNINESISKNFECLNSDSSIEGFKISDKSDVPILDIPKSDFDSLASKNEIFEEESKSKIIHDAKLIVFKIVFDEKYKWQFYYKGIKISASVSDKSFFKIIDEGKKFSKGDILVCELQINQLYDKTVNAYVNKSYEINRVTQHTPRPEQQKFEFK